MMLQLNDKLLHECLYVDELWYEMLMFELLWWFYDVAIERCIFMRL